MGHFSTTGPEVCERGLNAVVDQECWDHREVMSHKIRCMHPKTNPSIKTTQPPHVLNKS